MHVGAAESSGRSKGYCKKEESRKFEVLIEY